MDTNEGQWSNCEIVILQLDHSWGGKRGWVVGGGGEGSGHPAVSQKIPSVYKVNLSHITAENNHQVASDTGCRSETGCYASIKRWHVNHRRREKEEELTEMLKQV